MTLEETLGSVWRQALVEERSSVELEGQSCKVTRTRSSRLRVVDFSYESHRVTGIEQNPRTNSRWAMLARRGKRVMQFSCQGRYIANVCEGELLPYAAWKSLRLPE